MTNNVESVVNLYIVDHDANCDCPICMSEDIKNQLIRSALAHVTLKFQLADSSGNFENQFKDIFKAWTRCSDMRKDQHVLFTVHLYMWISRAEFYGRKRKDMIMEYLKKALNYLYRIEDFDEALEYDILAHIEYIETKLGVASQSASNLLKNYDLNAKKDFKKPSKAGNNLRKEKGDLKFKIKCDKDIDVEKTPINLHKRLLSNAATPNIFKSVESSKRRVENLSDFVINSAAISKDTKRSLFGDKKSAQVTQSNTEFKKNTDTKKHVKQILKIPEINGNQELTEKIVINETNMFKNKRPSRAKQAATSSVAGPASNDIILPAPTVADTVPGSTRKLRSRKN